MANKIFSVHVYTEYTEHRSGQDVLFERGIN